MEGIELVIARFGPLKGVWCASPDNGGEPERLDFEATSDGKPYVRIRLPRLSLWNMVWAEE